MKKKFCVYMHEEWIRRIDVEAESEEEAKNAALAISDGMCQCRLTERPPQAYFEFVQGTSTDAEEFDEDEQGIWVGVP